MNLILGNSILLIIFSLSLAIVVSGYRHDTKQEVLTGIVRRGLKFTGAVVTVATISWALSWWLS